MQVNSKLWFILSRTAILNCDEVTFPIGDFLQIWAASGLPCEKVFLWSCRLKTYISFTGWTDSGSLDLPWTISPQLADWKQALGPSSAYECPVINPLVKAWSYPQRKDQPIRERRLWIPNTKCQVLWTPKLRSSVAMNLLIPFDRKDAL